MGCRGGGGLIPLSPLDDGPYEIGLDRITVLNRVWWRWLDVAVSLWSVEDALPWCARVAEWGAWDCHGCAGGWQWSERHPRIGVTRDAG